MEITFKFGDQFTRHITRDDGTRDIYFGKIGEQDHGHGVIGENGNVRFLREEGRRIVCDDRIGGLNVPPGGGTHPW